MASSTHWIASQVAMRSLEHGGNAFDAAVAAGFVLHVVEPHLSGPCGEVTAIVATRDGSSPRVLSGQGPAPARATVDHFTSLGLELIPGSGPLAAAVPGAVDAWLMLLRDYGTQTLEEALKPAIQYADIGHPLLAGVQDTISTVADLFTNEWPSSAQIWLRNGRPPAASAMVANPLYAQTLQRLVEEGCAAGTDREAQIEAARRAWSQGFVAEAVEAFTGQVFRDSTGAEFGSLVTASDMASFSATWEEPATLDWRGYTVAKTRAWGQGPVLLQSLATLDALGAVEAHDPSAAAGIHVIAESLKLAFADREAWYGDEADVPLETLLSKRYATERARLVGDRASAELRPGSPNGRSPRAPACRRNHFLTERPAEDTIPGTKAIPHSSSHGDTCHVDVVDRWGNMVSATPSGGVLQGSPAIPGLGFALGTRLQGFWLEEGLAASLAPGRRPRTTLTPTMVLRDGQPVLACGSPGGDQQDQWQLLFPLRHLGRGESLQEAIDAPMWHTRNLIDSFYPREMEPGVLVVEDRLDGEVVDDLEARDHRIRTSPSWSLGRISAVSRDLDTNVLSAGASPRGLQSYACGR